MFHARPKVLFSLSSLHGVEANTGILATHTHSSGCSTPTERLLHFAAVCVAGYSPSQNELLELRLPPRLLAEANKVGKSEGKRLGLLS